MHANHNPLPFKRALTAMMSGPRQCDQCRQGKPKAGGRYVLTGAHTQKWLCADCAANAERRRNGISR